MTYAVMVILPAVYIARKFLAQALVSELIRFSRAGGRIFVMTYTVMVILSAVFIGNEFLAQALVCD